MADWNSEEDVKIKFLIPYLQERGYKQNCIDFNVSIEVQEGRKRKTIFADALVYTTVSKKAPLILCETKASTEILDRAVREQAISYARLLPRIAPLSLITNGSQIQAFHTLNKRRVRELPQRSELDSDILKFALDRDTQESLRDEAKHNLFIIDDVRTFKSILKSCHNEIRNNEGLDPTAAFDEMSKIMFCKLYEEKENPAGNRFRLSTYDDSLEHLGVNVIRHILENAKALPFYAGLFDASTRIELKDRTIRKIVSLFESYDLGLTEFDVKGEAFEYFLGDTFTGGLGEFFTPRNIVEFMIDAIDPKIGDRIIDPFCGTGGFLIYAFELVGEKIGLQEFSEGEKKRWRYDLSNRCLFGSDWKDRTSQACKMNMMVHGDGSSGVFKHDGFVDIPGKIEEVEFDICLTNPPFGAMENDQEILNRYELGSGRKSQDRVILALERSLRLVRPGGLIGIVVIDGVLNNPSTRYVREYIKRHAWVRGIVSLAKETFEGYGARAKTSILLLEKKKSPDEGKQDIAFMAIARNTGLAPNGEPIPGNVLPDILMDYKAFQTDGAAASMRSGASVRPIQDRLDAEFYVLNTDTNPINLSSVRSQVEDSLSRVAKTYATLEHLEEILSNLATTPTRLGDILIEVKEKEALGQDRVYRLLGVRWWGDGTFVREEKRGREIKAKSLYRVSAGWIVYNRLFAFRGSFAIVKDDHDGCFVSGEFPTFTTKEEIENGDLVRHYIVHCLNSPQFLALVDSQSTGSTKTSRNRFNQKLFMDLTVQLPTNPEELKKVVHLLGAAGALRAEQESALVLSKKLREGAHRMLPGARNAPLVRW